MDVIVAPFPIMATGNICGYRQDYWHISPDVDLPGIRRRGGKLCSAHRASEWSGPEYPPQYIIQSKGMSRPVCPSCLRRLESIIRRWDSLYPKTLAHMQGIARNGHVPRASVRSLGYTLPLEAAILPHLPSPSLAGLTRLVR